MRQFINMVVFVIIPVMLMWAVTAWFTLPALVKIGEQLAGQ